MILSLQSTGPDYNHLRANVQIPWNCEYVEYYVESINVRDICVVTDEDYIEYYYEDPHGFTHDTHRYQFKDSYHVKPEQFRNIFEHVDPLLGQVMTVAVDSTFRLQLQMNLNVHFEEITRLAGLVTGLQHEGGGEIYDAGDTITFERPVKSLYDKLYLVSKQGQSIQSSVDGKEYTPSIIASIDYPIREGTPILYNFEMYGKPIKNIMNTDSFKQIELELVDFQYQPVKLMSPMFVTIRVNPADTPKMKLH